MAAQTETTGPGLLARLLLAFFLPWKILFDRAFAEQVEQLAGGEPESALPPSGRPLVAHHEHPREAAAEPEEKAVELPKADPTGALLLLGILQREGRLLDFLQEDVSAASDQEVGAAARVVHEGCRRALGDYLKLEPVIPKEEGAPVTVERGFDAGKVRLAGNVFGEPPFEGRLAHPGWRAVRFDLPVLSKGMDPAVVAPAEVEIS
ncbi:MAG: DUF2760 domain-containing protein [Myxococcota bacterium]